MTAIHFTDGTPATEFEQLDEEVEAPDVTTLVVVQPQGVEQFEGSPVGMSEIKISGVCSIDGGDMRVSMDDRVRAVGEYRVVNVKFYAHPKTGETVRQQVLTPTSPLVVVPFDPSNPNDDGIIRARP